MTSYCDSTLRLTGDGNVRAVTFPIVSSNALNCPGTRTVHVTHSAVGSFLLSPRGESCRVAICVILCSSRDFRVKDSVFKGVGGGVPSFVTGRRRLLEFRSYSYHCSHRNGFANTTLSREDGV